MNEEKRKKLSRLETDILIIVVRESINKISYRNPQKVLRLGVWSNDKEVIDALRGLEDNYGFVKLVGSSFFGFNTSKYHVDLKGARELYNELVFG
ncbi:MAG: hypothetical protein WC533_03960 [Candidatus Pacearchaeota archaeon]